MTGYNDSSYKIPISQEGLLRAPETDVDRALRDALEAAPDIRSLDPKNVDSTRIENVGAATISSASHTDTRPEPVKQEYYNPSDPHHLLQVGAGVQAMRLAETNKAA